MRHRSPSVLRKALVKENRSNQGIIHSEVDVKSWMAKTPSVDAARPSQCPWCGNSGRPFGRPLGIQGHGLRDRQQRGPLAPAGPPEQVCVSCRRYSCRACDAVLMVVPRGVVPRRHFSSLAIGLALALFGHCGQTAATVRRRVSPWRIAGAGGWSGWITLRRWIAAIRHGALFADAPATPANATARQVAERVAMALAAQAPPGVRGQALEVQAFLGAARMA